jgi:hypothetical protein
VEETKGRIVTTAEYIYEREKDEKGDGSQMKMSLKAESTKG